MSLSIRHLILAVLIAVVPIFASCGSESDYTEEELARFEEQLEEELDEERAEEEEYQEANLYPIYDVEIESIDEDRLECAGDNAGECEN